MQSLRQICSIHAHVLAIDSASASIQVGLLKHAAEAHWQMSADEAGTGIFSMTDALLTQSGLRLENISAFIFCEGPGSVLGIRTAAVALRTWSMLQSRPIFAYGSLDLVAKHQLHVGIEQSFSVIADARRESWHIVTTGETGTPLPLRRVKLEALSGPLLMPEHFRTWATPPPEMRIVPYSIARMFEALPDVPLFRETQEPDAFLHEEPVYQTWTPRVHRAPS